MINRKINSQSVFKETSRTYHFSGGLAVICKQKKESKENKDWRLLTHPACDAARIYVYAHHFKLAEQVKVIQKLAESFAKENILILQNKINDSQHSEEKIEMLNNFINFMDFFEITPLFQKETQALVTHFLNKIITADLSFKVTGEKFYIFGYGQKPSPAKRLQDLLMMLDANGFLTAEILSSVKKMVSDWTNFFSSIEAREATYAKNLSIYLSVAAYVGTSVETMKAVFLAWSVKKEFNREKHLDFIDVLHIRGLLTDTNVFSRLIENCALSHRKYGQIYYSLSDLNAIVAQIRKHMEIRPEHAKLIYEKAEIILNKFEIKEYDPVKTVELMADFVKLGVPGDIPQRLKDAFSKIVPTSGWKESLVADIELVKEFLARENKAASEASTVHAESKDEEYVCERPGLSFKC